MTVPELRRWAAPVVYLSNNWISLAGVVIVTTSTVFWLFLLPATLRGVENPYSGILLYLALPALFFSGLILIPLGIAWRRRRERTAGNLPTDFPPLDFRNLELRRLAAFVVLTTFVNVVIAGQLAYSAVNYMDSTGFCGQACHSVMNPEFTAHQAAPHSNVDCVKCHIGPGAGSFVRAKMAGVRQLFALASNTYSRPIPTPVHNLRAARETCGECHASTADFGDRLRVVAKFGAEENNPATKTVLLLHVGGGKRAQGIHGAHLGAGVRIRYAHSDDQRQNIPWVEHRDAAGKVTAFTASDVKAAMPGNLPIREMDCLDCHNRPSHTYEMPEAAVDRALASGAIAASLPFAKQQSMELVKRAYASSAEAAKRIPADFEAYYQQKYPAILASRRPDIVSSAAALAAIYGRNVFPEMKIAWGTYPNHLGHTDSPGCFRCHDDGHVAPGGAKITQDCTTCHNVLAMEEAAPKILSDIGLDK
ncbi:MAG: cytochrome C [Candidatus Solibacter usitatus]|nr:cytochrome C [Candidatus Solibacter usitatus]